MGATMEVRYILLSVKMPIESTKKSANYTYKVLTHTTPHRNTSASLRFINLPKKHVRHKSNARFYPTMPVKQTVSIRSPNAKRGSILMEDAGLTLNNKGEVAHTSNSVPPSFSGTVVAAALLALADSSNKDLYLPAIHAPPGPCTNHFSGNKSLTKTEIAMEHKAAKEAKQKEAEGKKAAATTCKADNLAKKQKKGSLLLRQSPALWPPKLKLSAASSRT
jgi:hypothetical protein